MSSGKGEAGRRLNQAVNTPRSPPQTPQTILYCNAPYQTKGLPKPYHTILYHATQYRTIPTDLHTIPKDSSNHTILYCISMHNAKSHNINPYCIMHLTVAHQTGSPDCGELSRFISANEMSAFEKAAEG